MSKKKRKDDCCCCCNCRQEGCCDSCACCNDCCCCNNNNNNYGGGSGGFGCGDNSAWEAIIFWLIACGAGLLNTNSILIILLFLLYGWSCGDNGCSNSMC